MSQLVDLGQRIAYLARKKTELQTPIQELRAKIRQTRLEKKDLKPLFENFEYQQFETLSMDLERLKSSAEYCLNAGNEDYFLVKEVRRLEQMGPGLQRFEKLKKQYRDDMLSLTELEQIYKATCEDLERLRHIERNTLEGSQDLGGSESDESTSFYQMLQE